MFTVSPLVAAWATTVLRMGLPSSSYSGTVGKLMLTPLRPPMR
jgi:hypothetical protein